MEFTMVFKYQRKMLTRTLALALSALLVSKPTTASANITYGSCSGNFYGHGKYYFYFTKVFAVDDQDGSIYSENSNAYRRIIAEFEEELKRETGIDGNFWNRSCRWFDNESQAKRDAPSERPQGAPFTHDWVPTMAMASAPQSRITILTLDFEPGDGSGFLHARRGYRSASIKLNYRFLLCANEIQMAYALDRKSLEHSQDYVDRFNGLNPNTIVPNSEPPVPMTVPLAVKIVQAVPGTPHVATIRDGTAGEALGMGCFTGQTARVGFVAKLIGPQATRPQIKAFIDTLRADDITPGASLGYALINPDVPVPPVPAPRPRAPVRRKAT
jgi:hypothetical protein